MPFPGAGDQSRGATAAGSGVPKSDGYPPGSAYANPLALAADVERRIGDEPVSVYRDRPTTRLMRWGRRNRTAVTGMAGLIVAGFAGLATVAVVQARANTQLDNALTATREAKKQTERVVQAQEATQQAEAINTLLMSVFRSPDPAHDGRTIKVVDALDRAAATLQKEFTGSEATKGTLLDVLSMTYKGLALYDNAWMLGQKARMVREAALGPDHPDTLTTCINLIQVSRSVGRMDEAIKLGDATLKRCESKFGPDHAMTLAVRHHLGGAYSAAGRWSESIELLKETLKLRETKFGRDDYATLETRNSLANAYWYAGRPAEAIALHEVTFKLCERKLVRTTRTPWYAAIIWPQPTLTPAESWTPSRSTKPCSARWNRSWGLIMQ